MLATETMSISKKAFQARIQRIVAHRDNPRHPVDAATLLHAESDRLSTIGHPLAQKMSWAFRLSAAKLESICDPATLVQFQRVKP